MIQTIYYIPIFRTLFRMPGRKKRLVFLVVRRSGWLLFHHHQPQNKSVARNAALLRYCLRCGRRTRSRSVGKLMQCTHVRTAATVVHGARVSCVSPSMLCCPLGCF